MRPTYDQLKIQRDEARAVARRLLKAFAAHYSAIGGDTPWGQWMLECEHPWLTTDQPATEEGEEGRGVNECSACGLTGYHAASVSSFHSREVGWVTRSLCSDCNQWGHTASAAGYRLSEDIAVIARKAAHVQRLIKYAQLTTDQPAPEAGEEGG